MAEWKNVIDNFSEKERHYRDTYMETAEALDDVAEVDVFSREKGDWEIYVSFGIMYGISYLGRDDAEIVRQQMKKDILDEYEKNHGSSDAFIDEFAEKYKLQIENSLFNESDFFEAMMKAFY